MFHRIVSTVFSAAVVVVSTTIAVRLLITGHTLQIGGLLLMIGGVLAAVMFGFKLAEGLGPDQTSIYAGPLSRVRPRTSSTSGALRKAA